THRLRRIFRRPGPCPGVNVSRVRPVWDTCVELPGAHCRVALPSGETPDGAPMLLPPSPGCCRKVPHGDAIPNHLDLVSSHLAGVWPLTSGPTSRAPQPPRERHDHVARL